MFKASFQLPPVIGEEIYPNEMQAPPTVRAYVDASKVPSGQDPDVLARQLVSAHQAHLSHWLQGARQLATAAGNTGYTRQYGLPGITMHYSRNFDMETITLYLVPGANPGFVEIGQILDVRTDFFVWPVPGSQNFSDPPAQWEFATGDGNGEGTFYSFYDLPFSPGDRKPATPPIAAPGAALTDEHSQHLWYDPSPSEQALFNPSDNDGFVVSLWLKDIGGTGFFDTLLGDQVDNKKQYWEVEIMRLPTDVPSESTHSKPGVFDDGSYYDDPTIHVTQVLYTRRWPAQLNTFLNPIIGVIPKHFYEKIDPPDKPGSYTPDELKTEKQLPPRDTLRFTHKVIGLDPTLTEPRSIGAVRSSTMKGDETIAFLNAIHYYVTIDIPFGPLFYEVSTKVEVDDNLGRFYTYNEVNSGWGTPLFTGPLGPTTLKFFICGGNPYYDVPAPLRPAIIPTKSWALWEFSVAEGEVYQIIDDAALNSSHAPEGSVSGTSFSAPESGPPPGFLAAGAPARRWPIGTGPYWRNCGTIGGAWYGPAYVFVDVGPVFHDPDLPPDIGPVTHVQNGVAIPNTALSREGGDVTTEVFHDQVFGDFLRQPLPVDEARQPREVVVPYHGPIGYAMPVIKGRGDNITHYRDEVTADSNFDPTNPNDGYDTGVDLGNIAVGDRIMIATDTSTGKIWFGKNGDWIGPDKAPADPAKNLGHAALMDREKDPNTGKLKPAEYYAACSYRYGPTWVRMHLGAGLKHKIPNGFKALGLIRIDQ